LAKGATAVPTGAPSASAGQDVDQREEGDKNPTSGTRLMLRIDHLVLPSDDRRQDSCFSRSGTRGLGGVWQPTGSSERRGKRLRDGRRALARARLDHRLRRPLRNRRHRSSAAELHTSATNHRLRHRHRARRRLPPHPPSGRCGRARLRVDVDGGGRRGQHGVMHRNGRPARRGRVEREADPVQIEPVHEIAARVSPHPGVDATRS
jgi:hypothetical protein